MLVAQSALFQWHSMPGAERAPIWQWKLTKSISDTFCYLNFWLVAKVALWWTIKTTYVVGGILYLGWAKQNVDLITLMLVSTALET